MLVASTPMTQPEAFHYRPSLAELAKAATRGAGPERAWVIGISGYGGSGKSTLARALSGALDACVVSIDEFGTAGAMQRSSDWSGLDRQRLIDQVLAPIRTGARTIGYDSCDDWRTWHTNRVERTVGNVLILEGIGIFHPTLLPFLDHTIWLDVDLDTATAQGIARAQSRGQSEEHAWREIWAPNERDFDRRFTPGQRADQLVTPG